MFGPGTANAHPELVVAIVHAASSDWAARVIGSAPAGHHRRAGRGRLDTVRPRWPGGGAQYCAAVTGILTALSALAVFVAMMVVALTEALDAHRRWR